MMLDKFSQDNNNVTGDIVGGDKITIIEQIQKVEVDRATRPIRERTTFLVDNDAENTTLTKKLKDGRFNSTAQRSAIMSKLDSIQIIIQLNKSEQGKQILADIYQNLMTVVNRFVIPLDDGELLKYHYSSIAKEFAPLRERYRDVLKDILDIDDAFLEGLLFIATSNCAIRWRMEEIS